MDLYKAIIIGIVLLVLTPSSTVPIYEPTVIKLRTRVVNLIGSTVPVEIIEGRPQFEGLPCGVYFVYHNSNKLERFTNK